MAQKILPRIGKNGDMVQRKLGIDQVGIAVIVSGHNSNIPIGYIIFRNKLADCRSNISHFLIFSFGNIYGDIFRGILQGRNLFSGECLFQKSQLFGYISGISGEDNRRQNRGV